MGLAALAIVLFAVPMAFAAADVEVMENGGEPLVTYRDGGVWRSDIAVEEGDDIRSRIEVEITGNDHFNAVSVDYVNDFVGRQCLVFGEKTQNGRYVIEVEQAGPLTEARHDYVLKGYGVDGPGQSYNCSDADELFSVDVDGRITVVDEITSGNSNNSTTGNAAGGSTSSTDTRSATEKAIEELRALIASLTGSVSALAQSVLPSAVCSQMPTDTSALQSFLMGPVGGQASVFNNAGVYAATGFYGPITTQAVANFKSANRCR